MSEPGPRRRPFDQPGDVGDYGLAVLPLDRPQPRRERREGIVGDLRRSPGQPREQRALARVRQPHQPHVGEQLQPQLDPVRLPFRPFLGEARRLPGRGGEAFVPVAAAAALGDDRGLPRHDQVDLGALDRHRLRPRRHRDHPVLAASAVAVRAFAMTPPLGAEVLRAAQRPEVAARGIADQHHVAPVPAVAAVGPALRHVGFAAEGDAAVAAAAALDPDFRGVVHPSKDEARGSRAA
jgi:hypothetical protein